jgi:hypothetical protein
MQRRSGFYFSTSSRRKMRSCGWMRFLQYKSCIAQYHGFSKSSTPRSHCFYDRTYFDRFRLHLVQVQSYLQLQWKIRASSNCLPISMEAKYLLIN